MNGENHDSQSGVESVTELFGITQEKVDAHPDYSSSSQFVLQRRAASSQLRNDSVLTHFYSDSRTATSSATSEYETVPERPSKN